MGSRAEVSGPDLRAGIALAEMKESIPLLGHVDDQPVVLVRVGDEVFAVGATCTHWSGPLAEGIVTGTEIRCPWHHACFSLRTGDVIAPPALNPLPRWQVSVREGRAYVGDRMSDVTQPGTGAKSTPSSIVIAGAGAVGMVAAETLRKEGYTKSITLVDPDGDAPYDRPNLSKDFLAGHAPEEWLQLRDDQFWREHDITRVVAAVDSIDAASRAVALSNGQVLEYGALLLATGSQPIRLPIPGNDRRHVHVLRTRADCTRLVASLENKPRVVVAGASFIGMEAAAALRQRGIDVAVVAPEAVPFARVLGDEVGRVLQGRHEREGVRFHLGRTLKQINERDVVLDNDEVLPADLVLLGVGVRPSLGLAEAAGLVVDRGVVVNELLETSVTGIFAAGDIARYPDPRSGELIRIEHWVLAQRQAQAAARNMLGGNEPFTAAPFFWTTQYDVTVAYVGHASRWDSVRIDGSVADLDCAISYLADGQVWAVATINRDQVSLKAEVALESNQNLQQVTAS